jgi:hypothetical protein
MRLRTLLATAVAGTLLAGAAGVPAEASRAPSPARAGSVVAWSDPEDPNPGAAVPEDLTEPVVDIAVSGAATAAVTTEGHLRVWGLGAEADAPAGITDAVAVTMAAGHGAVLRTGGKITAWGDEDVAAVPSDLRAKAIAVTSGGTGYAVRLDGTLTTWGADNSAAFPLPTSGLTNLVDVATNPTGSSTIALRADGTVIAWSADPADPAATVPDLGGRKVTQIVAGGGVMGVVLDDGTIKVWGVGAPTGEPDFEGKKVVNLALGFFGFVPLGGAITEDGVVHTWGAASPVQSHPASLEGHPAGAIAIGVSHAAAVLTTFREWAKPTITGNPQVGQVLTATPAAFTLAPDAPATGQWYADAAPIAGQAGTTLSVDAAVVGKRISYRSTATRGGKTITSASDELGPVTRVPSTTTLNVTPAAGAFGTARTATATVSRAGGAATGTVTFKVGSTEGTAVLADGKATWALPTTLAVGTQSVTASYQGDASTVASTSAAASVTVSQATGKVAAKAKVTGKSKKTAKKVTITVTVQTATGLSPAGNVTVTLKGKTRKTVTATVNAAGKAKVTVKNVKRGKYKATVAYAGNTNVAPGQASIKFKV